MVTEGKSASRATSLCKCYDEDVSLARATCASHLQSGFKVSRHYLTGPPQLRVPMSKQARPRFPDRRPNTTRGVFGMAGLAADFGIMDRDFTLIGYREIWGQESAFGLSRADARQH